MFILYLTAPLFSVINSSMAVEIKTERGDGQPLYYEHYREFWQRNLQHLDEMTHALDKNLSVLEKKYLDFDTLYDEIVRQIGILSTIYSSSNSLRGREYLLKLKALMRDYRARYSLEGVNFNLIHFLQMKIRENLEKSFEEYPRMGHRELKMDKPGPPSKKKEPRPAPAHQWHTFARNGLWFIIPCESSTVHPFHEVPVAEGNDPKRFSLTMAGGETILINDLCAPPSRGAASINFILIIKSPGRETAFAADRAGKKIMAERDFITPLMGNRKKTGMVKGVVRLFGRHHFFIDPRYPS